MPTIKKEKVDVDNKIVAAVIIYDIALVIATVAAMYYVAPLAILMLLGLASIDNEEITVEAEDKEELEEALWEVDL